MIVEKARFMALAMFTHSLLFCQAAGSPSDERLWWQLPSSLVTTPQRYEDSLGVINADAARGVGHAGWYGLWYHLAPQKIAFQEEVTGIADAAGLKRIHYFDTGELGDYLVYVSPEGELLYDAWSLPQFQGEEGSLHRFGLQAFIEGASWTQLAQGSSFGIAPFTYPDGRPPDPENWYDSVAKRDIDGNLVRSVYSNRDITDEIAAETGLDRVSRKRQANHDAVQGKNGWETVRLWKNDRGNRQYLDYQLRELSFVLSRFRPHGIHFDDFSGDNTLSVRREGFGEWSMAYFRDYVKARLSGADLERFGIEDIDTFDLVRYFKSRPWRSASEPDIDAQYWYSEEWTRDIVFRLYQMSLIESGRAYYRKLYEAVKHHGKDVAVFGNVIPTFPSAALRRGYIDVLCFEWKTFKTYGLLKNEMGIPPRGRIGWVSRLGAQISGTGYTVASIYVPHDMRGERYDELHKVLQFDCMANRAVCDFGHWFLDGYSPGTPESAGFGNVFLKAIRSDLGNRNYVADIGIVYCPWSQHAANVMGGHQGNSPSGEMFLREYAGWAEYLSRSHWQWDVLLSEDLAGPRLRDFKVVILPSILSLTYEQVEALTSFVDAGGRLVITGRTGEFDGPDSWLMPHQADVLEPLRQKPQVRLTDARPGVAYRNNHTSTSAESLMEALLDFEDVRPVLVTDAPNTVGVSLSRDVENPFALSLDLVNYDIDIEANRITLTKPFTVSISHPLLRGRSEVTVAYVTAQSSLRGQWRALPFERAANGKNSASIEIMIKPFTYYSIIRLRLEPQA